MPNLGMRVRKHLGHISSKIRPRLKLQRGVETPGAQNPSITYLFLQLRNLRTRNGRPRGHTPPTRNDPETPIADLESRHKDKGVTCAKPNCYYKCQVAEAVYFIIEPGTRRSCLLLVLV